MNKIINNLAQIAAAAEYFDRATGAAWKIRATLTNALVWSANGYLYALETDSVERIARSMIELSTLRSWARDCDTNAFALDLLPGSVAKTLGLERQVDVHEEACRVARQKCLQTRSAMKFKLYYDNAIAAFEEQRRVRAERVDTIAQLLADTGWMLDEVLADHFETHLLIKVPGFSLSDADLYDDAAVEAQADRLAETVGNALESMYDECETQLAAAITTDKIGRLSGYSTAINNMLVITGVDMKKLAARRAALEHQIEMAVEQEAKSVAQIDAEITAQMAEVVAPPSAPVHANVDEDAMCDILAANKPQKPKRMRRVKKEDLAAELART
mgnify:CR=1 FL=1